MTDETVVKDQKHDDFYRKLRKRMREWREGSGKEHKWAEYLMFAPDLFYTLGKLMIDPDVPARNKAEVVGTIAYFVLPVDLVPEAVVGPIGYIDDVILVAYVLNGIINVTREEVVERNWPGDENVLSVIKRIIGAASDILGVGLLQRLLKKKEQDGEEGKEESGEEDK